MFGLIRALGNSGVVPPTPPAAQAPGTGGPRPRRRFELDLRPERQRQEPERKPQQRRRRIPEVHVALSLTASLPVLLMDAQVANLEPITAQLTLPPLAVPVPSVRVQIMGLLGLATERIDELEAVLAAVVEDE